MPFNSNSYHRNKAKREAREYIATARRLKALNPGRALPEVASAVRIARANWRTYLSYCKISECDEDMKRCRKGEMTYADFIAKWKD